MHGLLVVHLINLASHHFGRTNTDELDTHTSNIVGLRLPLTNGSAPHLSAHLHPFLKTHVKLRRPHLEIEAEMELDDP